MVNSEDDGSVLMHPTIVMNGSMNNVSVRIMKDDGWNISSLKNGKLKTGDH